MLADAVLAQHSRRAVEEGGAVLELLLELPVPPLIDEAIDTCQLLLAAVDRVDEPGLTLDAGDGGEVGEWVLAGPVTGRLLDVEGETLFEDLLVEGLASKLWCAT